MSFVVYNKVLNSCYGPFPTEGGAGEWAKKFFYTYEVLPLKGIPSDSAPSSP